MKILLASPRGFCAGVNMAIESLDLTLREFGAPVYVYHEIVHNKYVVETFQDKGAVFVDTLEEVPEGNPPKSSIEKSQRHRRNLPTGDKSSPRSSEVCARRVHHIPDRARRSRRSDRHNG